MKIQRKKMNVVVPSMAMGDIAFNLLIFFVILARANDDSHVNWTPAKTVKLEQAGFSKVSVIIDHDNKIFLNGGNVGLAQLAPAVEEMLGDMPAGERTVLLKIHNDAPALHFEPVIEAISEAGGDLVHILEKENE